MHFTKKLNLLAFLSLILTSSSLWGKSHIDVHFPGAENQKATIWTYKDLISMSREIVAEVKIDRSGRFSFDTHNRDVQLYFIEVKYFRSSFYVEKNTNYELKYEYVDFNRREYYPKDVVGYLNPPFQITKPTKGELNSELDSLNLIFDQFIQKNHLALSTGQQSWKLVDTLEMTLNAFLEDHSNPFLHKNANIQLAQFRMMSNQFGEDYVVETYFAPDKIAYSDPSYMSFFRSFWTKYIASRTSYQIRKQLDSVINKERSYQALSALLAEDSLLKDPIVRELVILRNIPQLYRSGAFDKEAISDILIDINASKYRKEHQRIAFNLRKKIEANQNLSKAPDFYFIDHRSDTLNLKGLEGKYIYIQLWNNECIECLAQMKYTEELYEKFEDIITFIHISVDRNEADMKSYIDDDYKWHFVFLEDNYHFIQNYQISVLPRTILIDKEGKIIAMDARLPTDYFEDYFLKMLNDKKGNLHQRNDMRNGIGR